MTLERIICTENIEYVKQEIRLLQGRMGMALEYLDMVADGADGATSVLKDRIYGSGKKLTEKIYNIE